MTSRLITPMITALLFLGGCQFGANEAIDTSKLTCDANGCLLCENFTCYQYSCDTDFQCPDGYGCTTTNECMPAGITNQTPVGGGGPGVSAPSGNTDPTDPPPAAGSECSISAQCATGQMCVNGACQADAGVPSTPSTPDCVADADCGAGEFCNAGDCNSKEFPLRPEGTCQFSLDCGAVGTCINTRCYFPPADGASCPTGATLGSGLCLPSTEPAGECQFNSECGGSALCINATCNAICSADAECGAATYCGAAGLCVLDDRPILQCLATADCAHGNSCVDGRCLSGCGAAATCSTEGDMCSFGFCMPTATCFLKADCATNFDCINGSCDVLGTDLPSPAEDPTEDDTLPENPAEDEPPAEDPAEDESGDDEPDPAE